MEEDEIFDDDDMEESCPKCGHYPINVERCHEVTCEDGFIDESDEDYLYEGSTMVKCHECDGTGFLRWCPECGHDLNTLP